MAGKESLQRSRREHCITLSLAVILRTKTQASPPKPDAPPYLLGAQVQEPANAADSQLYPSEPPGLVILTWDPAADRGE